MRIGGRWAAGSPPPRGLPTAMLDALRAAERTLPGGEWTLTWLEDRPVVEHDSGYRLAFGPDGHVHGDAPGAEESDAPAWDDEDEDDLFPDRPTSV